VIPRCETCPQSGDLLCHAYEHLCRKHAAEPKRWRQIVLRHSAVIDGRPVPAQAQAIPVPTGKPCGGC